MPKSISTAQRAALDLLSRVDMRSADELEAWAERKISMATLRRLEDLGLAEPILHNHTYARHERWRITPAGRELLGHQDERKAA